MQPPRIPENEASRLRALRELDVMFTPAEERFERITRLAQRLYDVPITVISLMADKYQWFKSAQGMDGEEASRETSFCGHVILGDDTMVVDDAALDARFADNPVVTGGLNVRFYAGQPLHAADGSRVGTLCLIDRKPRHFSAEQLDGLRDLAAIVESELQRGQPNENERALVHAKTEPERRAMLDVATRLWNEAGIAELLRGELARAQRGGLLCAAVIGIDNLDKISARVGAEGWSAAVKEIAKRIRRATRAFDAVGRHGEGDFALILSACNVATAQGIVAGIQSALAAEPIATPAGQIAVTASVGLAAFKPAHTDPAFIVGDAEAALFRARKKGANHIEVTAPAETKAAWRAPRL